MSKENNSTINITWQIEKTHPLMVKPLRAALEQVMDPEIHLNIIQLGLVRDVILGKEEANIKMVLTTPFCPYGPTLLESARQKAELVFGRPTKVELAAELWTPLYMEEDLRDDWGLF